MDESESATGPIAVGIANMDVPGASSTTPSGPSGTRGEIKKPKKKKVLLMGKSGSGKSSMRSMIFSNYLARDTRRLGATIDIDLSHVKFLGNLTLNLWDCGGQEAFMENYLSQQRMHVFSNVGVLIYVFDIESRDVDRDLATYVSIISALAQFSPAAKIFILIHKMDLIPRDSREDIFYGMVRAVRQKTSEYVAAAGGAAGDDGTGEMELTPFATSIWDQSLYKAWASIIHDLVPNLTVIERDLGNLGILLEAEEIMLFERTSFLVISHWASDEGGRNPFDDRQDRMTNILKAFKSGLSNYTGTPRNAEQFKTFEYKAGLMFSMFIDKFTTNTYIMVVLPPGEARFNSAKLNVQIAARQFEHLDTPNPAAVSAAKGAKGASKGGMPEVGEA